MKGVKNIMYENIAFSTNSTDQPTAVCKNWGFGLDFTHCFVLLWSVIY